MFIKLRCKRPSNTPNPLTGAIGTTLTTIWNTTLQLIPYSDKDVALKQNTDKTFQSSLFSLTVHSAKDIQVSDVLVKLDSNDIEVGEQYGVVSVDIYSTVRRIILEKK